MLFCLTVNFLIFISCFKDSFAGLEFLVDCYIFQYFEYIIWLFMAYDKIYAFSVIKWNRQKKQTSKDIHFLISGIHDDGL